MGTKEEMGAWEQPGDFSAWRSLMRLEMRLASVVLPGVELMSMRSSGTPGENHCKVPEPGMPETAIRSRFEVGVC